MKKNHLKKILILSLLCVCLSSSLREMALAEKASQRETDIGFVQGDEEPIPPIKPKPKPKPKPPIKKPGIALPQTGEQRSSFLIIVGVLSLLVVLLLKKRIKNN